MMSAAPRLAERPDWPRAVQALADGLQCVEPRRRPDLLECVCTGLGDTLYPSFVQLLCAARRFGDADVQALLADALADAIATSQLPSRKLPAWGAENSGMAPALQNTLGFNVRSFGPIEFMCAAQWQGLGGGPFPRESFEAALRGLLQLIAASPRAVELYRSKLEADLADPLGGGFTHANRAQLASFVDVWRPNASIEPALAVLLV
jgi:hypothetical protein